MVDALIRIMSFSCSLHVYKCFYRLNFDTWRLSHRGRFDFIFFVSFRCEQIEWVRTHTKRTETPNETKGNENNENEECEQTESDWGSSGERAEKNLKRKMKTTAVTHVERTTRIWKINGLHNRQKCTLRKPMFYSYPTVEIRTRHTARILYYGINGIRDKTDYSWLLFACDFSMCFETRWSGWKGERETEGETEGEKDIDRRSRKGKMKRKGATSGERVSRIKENKRNTTF